MNSREEEASRTRHSRDKIFYFHLPQTKSKIFCTLTCKGLKRILGSFRNFNWHISTSSVLTWLFAYMGGAEVEKRWKGLGSSCNCWFLVLSCTAHPQDHTKNGEMPIGCLSVPHSFSLTDEMWIRQPHPSFILTKLRRTEMMVFMAARGVRARTLSAAALPSQSSPWL